MGIIDPKLELNYEIRMLERETKNDVITAYTVFLGKKLDEMSKIDINQTVVSMFENKPISIEKVSIILSKDYPWCQINTINKGNAEITTISTPIKIRGFSV